VDWSPELGKFCAVGDQLEIGGTPKIITSSDGISWSSPISNPALNHLHCVMWSRDDELFIATGLLGTMVTSPDGTTWTSRDSSVIVKNLTGAAEWNGSISVVVGGGAIISSSDGINWEEREHPQALSLLGVAWSGKVFVAVGGADGSDAYIVRSLPVS
jgi:hypothetical protein